jgi:hypothetical protein
MNKLMNMEAPKWGVYSFANGLQVPEVRTLEEQARRGGDDLLNAVGLLMNDGSDAAYAFAERLLDTYA